MLRIHNLHLHRGNLSSLCFILVLLLVSSTGFGQKTNKKLDLKVPALLSYSSHPDVENRPRSNDVKDLKDWYDITDFYPIDYSDYDAATSGVDRRYSYWPSQTIVFGLRLDL